MCASLSNQGMANLVIDHLRQGEPASKQFFLRCPGCTNHRCSKARHFIEGEAERLKVWTHGQVFRDPARGGAPLRRKLL